MTNEQLVARIKAGENEADNMLQLWQQNKGFIHKIAVKFQGYAEIDDLKQEGYIGLCAAVEHYEPVDGIPFINYAAFWIRQTMQRYIENCCNVVRLPVHAGNDVRKLKRIVNEYRKGYGKEPTEKEIETLLGVSSKQLQIIKENAIMTNVRSLSEPICGDDEEITLADGIASAEDIDDDVTKKLDTSAMSIALWEAVDNLPEELSGVIIKRYKERMTLQETGASIGITKERVRQEEQKALRKLRIPSRCKAFKEYYEEYLAASPIHHVGVEHFNRTWTSSVEAEALRYKSK